eukprot:14974832-Alexandrium_andersonii.AAC.1
MVAYVPGDELCPSSILTTCSFQNELLQCSRATVLQDFGRASDHCSVVAALGGPEGGPSHRRRAK